MRYGNEESCENEANKFVITATILYKLICEILFILRYISVGFKAFEMDLMNFMGTVAFDMDFTGYWHCSGIFGGFGLAG